MQAGRWRGGLWSDPTYRARMRGEDRRQGQQRLWISTTRWALLVALLGLVVILLDHHRIPVRHARHSLVASPLGSSTTVPSTPRTSMATGTSSTTRPTTPLVSSVPTASLSNVALSAPPTTLPSKVAPISAAPISAAPNQAQVETGWLDAPLSISATYYFPASTPRTVVATWSGAPSLSLKEICDGAVTSTSGGSGLTLSARGTSCSLTLAGPSDVVTTSYTVTIGTS
jgi:cytoskeletal protein RodZ